MIVPDIDKREEEEREAGPLTAVTEEGGGGVEQEGWGEGAIGDDANAPALTTALRKKGEGAMEGSGSGRYKSDGGNDFSVSATPLALDFGRILTCKQEFDKAGKEEDSSPSSNFSPAFSNLEQCKLSCMGLNTW